MNSDPLVSPPSWHSLDILSRAPRRRALSWPGLPSSPASRSRSISLLRLLWRLSAAGIFVVIGLLYSTTSLVAEWHYSAVDRSASRATALFHVKRAAAWFPLVGRYRAAPAYFYSFYRGPQEHTATAASCVMPSASRSAASVPGSAPSRAEEPPSARAAIISMRLSPAAADSVRRAAI